MQVGYLLCDGCDECRTDTIPADDEAHDWPCCEFFPDDKAPCCYVVIARCRSEVIHDLSFSDGCAAAANQALLMYPVFELRKKCYVGCEWVMDDCTEVEDQTTDALNPSFPPASLTAGAISYHQGDYRSGYTGCIASGSGPDRWTLAVSGTAAGDVTLTLTHTAIVAWATGDGRTIPVYENVEAWNPFGRNRMDIVAGYDDFPMLPKSICVVAVDDPGADDNPCDTHEDRCACNDFTIGDSVTFNIVVTGCEGYTFPSTINLTRYKDPDALPCGVEYPASDPCGVFIGELSTGDGCENEAGTWSGAVLLMFWCDGDTYNITAYCYDTELECWVEQGNATITELELTCDGTVYVEFTLPDMDCCCPEEEACCPCVEDDERIVEVNFNSASGCSLTGQTVQNSGSTGCIFILDGLSDGDCQVDGGGNIECSDDGTWTLGVTTSDGAMGGITDWSTPAMTLTVNSCDPLDLEWTGSQGTVTLVEVP
jgi:hypothetical protein